MGANRFLFETFGSVAILATFNLRDTSHGDPVPDRLQKVAAIISLMEADIVWLQEISKQVQLQTLRRLLPQYELRWANVGSAQGAPGTGLAMLYRKATVEILGEPELFPSVPRTASDTAFRWYRVPFSQTVRVGTLKCQLVNVRLYWGASSGERLQRRVEELKELVRWIERRKSEDPLIIAGCFNWPLDDPHMKTLQKPRLFFPSTKLPADATESCHGEIIKRYSHFALSTSIESCYIEGSVRYQELTPLYPDWSASEWSNFADLNPLLIALRVD